MSGREHITAQARASREWGKLLTLLRAPRYRVGEDTTLHVRLHDVERAIAAAKPDAAAWDAARSRLEHGRCLPDDELRAQIATTSEALAAWWEPAPEPTSDPEADFREQLGQHIEAGTRRRREALESTQFRSEEAAICEWLFSSVGGYDDLRARFPHGLEGIEDRQIGYVANVVRMALNALRNNDHEAIEAVVSARDEIAALKGKKERIRLVVRGVGSWMDRAMGAEYEAALADCRWMAFWVCRADETLALDEQGCRELTDRARRKTGTTFEVGNRKLAAAYLALAGWYDADEDQAYAAVIEALKKRPKR